MIRWGLVAAGVIVAFGTTPAAAAGEKPPLLSIAVDNGRTAVTAGDRLTYTVKVRNIGPATTGELEISQSLPPGLTFVSATRGGHRKARTVVWPADLKAGEDLTLTTVAKVGRTPVELLRLATVACATTKGDRKPRVCATHSDLLPAVAAAPARAGEPVSGRVWSGLALAMLALIATAVLLVARRRREQPIRYAPALARVTRVAQGLGRRFVK